MNLCDNLKKIRKENNLSQEELAEKLGVSRQSISKWESGLAYPELEKIMQICKIFNLNADDLLNKDIKEVKEIKQSKININKYIDDFLDYITKTINMFSSMSFKEKIKCLFEQCALILTFFIIVCIVGLIGSIIVSNLIGLLPFNAYNAIYNIIKSIYIVLCLSLGIILILHIFKVRYLDYYVIVTEEDLSKEQEIKSNEINKDKKMYLEKKKEKIIIRDEKYSGYKFISGLLNFFLKILKIVVACFGFGFCFSLIFLVSLIVLSFLFVKAKILFLGAFIILISCILINLILLYLIYNFIVSRKSKKNKCALLFVISLVMIGIGIAFMMIGITKIDYIDDLNNEKYYITKTKNIAMSDDLVIEDRYEYEVEYIESSNNDLKIEYKSSKYYDVSLFENDKVYYVHFKANSNNSIINLLNTCIKDINDYKIVDYSKVGVRIYTSKENIDKLKSNLYNYEEERINNNYN